MAKEVVVSQFMSTWVRQERDSSLLCWSHQVARLRVQILLTREIGKCSVLVSLSPSLPPLHLQAQYRHRDHFSRLRVLTLRWTTTGGH